MPVWEWVGYGSEGRRSGRGIADRPEELLRAHPRLLLTALKRVRPRQRARKLGSEQMTRMTRLLAIMAASGMSFPAMIEQLLSQAGDRRERDLLAAIAIDLRAGRGLCEAFERRAVFIPLYLAVLRACEEGGDKKELLSMLANTLEQFSRFRSKLVGGAIYPAILLLAGIAAIYLVAVLVVPSMRSLLGEDVQLPTLTLLLFSISDGLSNWRPGIGTGALMLVMLLLFRRILPVFRRLVGRLPVVREMHLARASAVLQMLVKGNVAITRALEIAADTGGVDVSASLRRARQQVIGGAELSSAFASESGLPSLWGRLTGAGEASGDYYQSFQMLSSLHEQSLQRSTDRLARIAEPLMVLLVGLFMTLVLLGLYLPVLQAGTAF